MQRRAEGVEFSPGGGWGTAARAARRGLAGDAGTAEDGFPGRGCPVGACRRGRSTGAEPGHAGRGPLAVEENGGSRA